MAAMSRPRSYSARRSPSSSPSHRPSVISTTPAERREHRRATTTNVGGSSNRGSILLSERQVNKINKKIANIRHNSLGSATASEFVAKYGDGTSISPSSFSQHLDFSLPKSLATSTESVQQTNSIPSPSLHTRHIPPRHSNTDSIDVEPIGTFPTRIQEYAVMEDLLYVLMGISGTYVKILYPTESADDDDPMEEDLEDEERENSRNGSNWDNVQYLIDPSLDPSLRHLVEKLLPLATSYISIDAFIDQYSRYEYGSINHALTAGMMTILKEYETFIAQLEHQFQTSSTFTLQQFWFYAQDTLQQMKILHDLANAIRNLRRREDIGEDISVDIEAVLEDLKPTRDDQVSEREKGGAILNVLTDRLIGLSGDPRCKKIYGYLLSRASVPYFEILHSWIYRGEIVDPYNEFMVLEKKSVKKENLKEDFNDTYWETRYTARDKLVPTFLEPLKSKILLAGKYLNVVRECGVNIAKPEDMQSAMRGNHMDTDTSHPPEGNNFNAPSAMETPWTSSWKNTGTPRGDVWSAVDGGRFVKSLEIAYRYANHTLLKLLLHEQQLLDRLRSLKHYFFLDQSDFLTSFLDLARDELRQPAREISLTRLQSLMDLVLRNSSSVAAYDPFKEDLKVSMSPLKLVDELLRIINVAGLDSLPGATSRDARWSQGGDPASHQGVASALERSQSMAESVVGGTVANTSTAGGGGSRDVLTGYDALTLDFTVTFPSSLVISRKALTKYQLLFRHLLYLKHVEDMLCDAWMAQKDVLWRRSLGNPDIDAWKFKIFTLRHRMLIFVQQFAYYVTNEVLEPNWRRLEANLSRVSTVDQVLQYHSDFLDTCLKECMLTNAKLLRIYNKLMTSCVVFAAHTEKFTQLLSLLEEQQTPNMFGIPRGELGDAAGAVAASFEKTNASLTKIEETFSYHIKLLIDALSYFSATETVQFLCLVVRLDYNQYHKSQGSFTRNK